MAARILYKIGIVTFTLTIAAIFLPGFFRLRELRSRSEKIDDHIEVLKEENKKLIEEKDRLENDPFYIEKVAREKLGVVADGEIVYKIIPEEGE